MAKSEEPIMSLEKVSLHRNGADRIIDGISFEVMKGEFLSIIGTSGAGKTTLLQAMAGLLSPSSGRIIFEGKELSKPSAEIGLMYQGYALFPWRTAIQNVEFGPEVRGVPKAERRELAEEALDLLGLLGHRDKYPRELSGGMQQRVALARVLVNRPRILLLDESFSALDVQTRRKIEEQLLEIQGELGITVVLVTHLVEQALAISDRAILLSKGTVGKFIELEGKKPRDIDAPGFRELLRQTEALIKPTPKLEVFVEELKKVERKGKKVSGLSRS